MKKKPALFLLIILCVTLMAAAGYILLRLLNAPKPQPPAGVETISVVMDDNYPPFVFRDVQGRLQGILVDQWALWSEKTGIKAEIHAMNWADALAGMRSGHYDVIDTVFFNEERETWLDFSAPYVTIDVPIFHSNQIGGITDAASLTGFTVAAKAGDACIPILREAGVTDIKEYASYEAVIDAAKRGDVTVFVVDEPAALYYLYQKGIIREFSQSQSLYSGQFHRAAKEGDAQMLALVESGFSRISSGERNNIDDKWFGRASTWIYIGYYLEFLLVGIAIVGAVILWVSLWNQRLRREVRKKTLELVHEKELLNITLQSIGDGVVATGIDGTITLLNPTARRMTGWEDDALGEKFTTVLQLINEETEQPVSSPIEKVLETGEIVGLANHTALVNRRGEKTPIADGAAPICDANGQIYGVVMVFRDVTQEKEQREKIEHIMSHDSMTGLYNRWYMEELLNRYDHEEQGSCALIMGDLNGLKLVNDAFGHYEGDRFIREVAAILLSSSGQSDVVCRWGGDEFLILMPDAGAADAERLIERILAHCKEKSDETLQLSIALGYALKKEPEEKIHDVLREAEQLTYRRKLMIEKSFRSSVINALLATLAAKSEETEEHAERLQHYCGLIGKILGISNKEQDEMSLFAMLHDIGKVGINDAILRKPSALSDAEWLEMKKHPEIGFRIAQNNVDLAPISEYILSHHERWDGSGYPRGLSGEEIPVPARILAVVDAFDAMTNERIYSSPKSREAAAEEILSCAGTQFDPIIARVFVEQVLGL
ncbi:MAG: transporter substrate-binding domain-containing protein [Eubacteriales bacterium]|jgi:diguanylate cyclase (GGDEF)-like protein/PAS domain S-box-containing protein|nr:transporter substrate-binding domain-containing protein [Eubacteriales bacterium]